MNYHKLVYYGTIDQGVLKLSDRKRFNEQLKLLEGKRVEVTVQKAKKRRSNQQNAFYWGVILPLVRDGFVDAGNEGTSVDDVHEYLKNRFLEDGKELFIPRTGETITVAKSTAALSTIEWNTYTEKIAQFAAEMLGVVIPEPTPLFSME